MDARALCGGASLGLSTRVSRGFAWGWIAPMGGGQPGQEKRRHGPAVIACVAALLCVLSAGGRAGADLRSPARSRGEPPMRFVRVSSANPACEPNCPEWLSAEGRIEPGSAPAFAEAINRLGAQRLPILVHSPGGSVADAMTMGKLVRARGLAVAVARTLLRNCSETAPRCPDGAGVAITCGATCASACALVLARGVERLVGPVPLIGVHQITTVVKETEGLAHVTSTRKFYEQDWADAAVRDYLTAMGVGDPVMALMRKTPAASVHWLSLPTSEPRIWRRWRWTPPSRSSQAAPTASTPAASTAIRPLPRSRRPVWPSRSRCPLRDAAGNCVQLSARRGAVEAEITARKADTRRAVDPPASGWRLTLTAGGGEPLQLQTAGAAPARAIIPRERFCAAALDGGLVAEPLAGALAGAWTAEPPNSVQACRDGR